MGAIHLSSSHNTPTEPEPCYQKTAVHSCNLQGKMCVIFHTITKVTDQNSNTPFKVMGKFSTPLHRHTIKTQLTNHLRLLSTLL